MSSLLNGPQAGDSLPNFQLFDPFGGCVDIRNYRGISALLIVFLDNSSLSCRRLHRSLAKLASEYQRRGGAVIGINPTAGSGKTEESATAMTGLIREAGFTFPYLIDAEQTTAKQFGVRRLPDFFVFNDKVQLAYRGRFDGTDALPDMPPTAEDLRRALNLVLRGETVPPGTPSQGEPLEWLPSPQTVLPSHLTHGRVVIREGKRPPPPVRS